MSKKAEATLAFNWIYIGVVGGLILIGALMTISKINKEARENFYFDEKAYISNFINMLEQNPNSEKRLNLQGTDIDLTCNDFTIRQSDQSVVSTANLLISSPDMIKSEIIGYSDFLEIPMKTIRQTYMTSPFAKYVLKNSPETNLLTNYLPATINLDSLDDYSDFRSKEYYKVRFITFGAVPTESEMNFLMNDNSLSISVVKIEILEDRETFPDSYGRATYYKIIDTGIVNQGEVYFFDRSTLLSAFFSEDQDSYYCNLDKAYKKLKPVLEIEKTRLKKVSGYDNAKQCNYEKILGAISEMQTYFLNDAGKVTVTQIYSLKNKIMEENRYLERLSCPILY